MSVIFSQPFLEALTDDEQALLYYIVNQDKNQGVVYELAYSRAGVVINKLQQAQLTDEGVSLKTSILEKFQTL
jgi:hypothetical protein